MKSLLPCLLLCTACQHLSHEHEHEHEHHRAPQAVEAAVPTEAEVMAMIAELAQPGPAHAVLNDLVGTFHADVKLWMAPDAPPQESTGTMVNSWTLGGRYLRGEYTGDMLGQAFQGVSLTGYDNAQQVYNGVWYDSMSTGMMEVSRGHREGDVITFEREIFDPMSKLYLPERDVLRIDGPDRHVFEMYMGIPGGGEMKSMEIVYTRK